MSQSECFHWKPEISNLILNIFDIPPTEMTWNCGKFSKSGWHILVLFEYWKVSSIFSETMGNLLKKFYELINFALKWLETQKC